MSVSSPLDQLAGPHTPCWPRALTEGTLVNICSLLIHQSWRRGKICSLFLSLALTKNPLTKYGTMLVMSLVKQLPEELLRFSSLLVAKQACPLAYRKC